MPRIRREFPSERRNRLSFRVGGVVAALVGAALTTGGIWMLFDPRIGFSFNGIPTTAIGPRLFYIAFSLGFFVLGLLMCFARGELLKRLMSAGSIWEVFTSVRDQFKRPPR